MKKLILLLISMMPLWMNAQISVSVIHSDPIDAFFNRYTGEEGYTTMDLSGDMSDLPEGYQKQMEPYAKMLLEGVTRMRIIVAEEYSASLMLDARKVAEKLGFKSVASGRTEDMKTGQYTEAFVYYNNARSGRNGELARCILGVMSTNSKVVIYIEGDFDITSVRSK